MHGSLLSEKEPLETHFKVAVQDLFNFFRPGSLDKCPGQGWPAGAQPAWPTDLC